MLLKKALRNGFSGCIQATSGERKRGGGTLRHRGLALYAGQTGARRCYGPLPYMVCMFRLAGYDACLDVR